MATTDTSNWDTQIGQLKDSTNQRFQNPQARDIAQHCVALLQDAMTIERNYSQGSTGKEGDYNTKNSPR